MSAPATNSDSIEVFIAGLPKAEVHVHHVGSATTQAVAQLAARHQGSTRVPADVDELPGYFDFTDFAHFIQVYLSVVDLIRDAQDVWTLTHEVGLGLVAQNVRHAELTVTPYSSITRGIAAADFCAAIEDARARLEAEHDLSLRWCFDIPGEAGLESGDITLATALEQQPAGLISFGLGGPEAGVARTAFATHFAAARAAGLHSVPHAGESTGPQTVWDAVTVLGAERIGHGIAAAQDAELMAYLAEHDVALEICPTSNVRTRSVPDMAAHPLPALAAAGVPFSINSDDPPMFSTTLNNEYAVAAGLLHLDQDGIADLARASVRQSFADTTRKDAILREIDDYVRVNG